jgi:hypothetical protein
MAQLVDYDIEKTDEPVLYERPPRNFRLVWIAIAVLAVIAVAGFLYLRRGASGDAETPAAAASGAAAPVTGVPVEPIALPPLDQTDTLVRQLVGALSSHPRVAAWLATDGLIRNFVVVVENISNGQTPAGHLRTQRPTGPFRVVERNGTLFIDPRNYARYDDLAGAALSVDAAGAAKIYTMLKPRIQDAYADLGYQQSFDIALSRAISSLLQVPPLDGDVPLEFEGATAYRYEDPRIEGLTAAQKQLARMGPGNVRAIQAKLRAVASALALPPA